MCRFRFAEKLRLDGEIGVDLGVDLVDLGSNFVFGRPGVKLCLVDLGSNFVLVDLGSGRPGVQVDLG